MSRRCQATSASRPGSSAPPGASRNEVQWISEAPQPLPLESQRPGEYSDVEPASPLRIPDANDVLETGTDQAPEAGAEKEHLAGHQLAHSVPYSLRPDDLVFGHFLL